MSDQTKYHQRVAVIHAMYRALDRCKHYQSFSKRIKTFFENELPDYAVHVYTSNPNEIFGRHGVRVWGNGLEYNNPVDISISVRAESWVESFKEALDSADPSDYAEREKDEEQLVPILQDLEARLTAIQNEAAALFERLPVPKSARVRKEANLWSSPSYNIRKRFPKLFP